MTAPVHFLRLRFLDMNPGTRLTAEYRTAARTSYLLGRDPSQWQRGIASYRKVRYHDIYPGIDLLFYGKQGQLEYDFVVSAGFDPGAIRLGFEGFDSMEVSPAGELVLTTAQGQLTHRMPHLFQEAEGRRTEIGGRYRLEGEEQVVVGFEVDSYDRTRPLVIDPVLDFSTYLGGSSDDESGGVATDSEGNIYLAGRTGSLDFPILNPFQEEFAGGGSLGDVFVTKFDPTGSSILYSTYIGGAGTDICKGIAVDSQGRAVVTGTTFSGNFPFTPGAFQTICSGQCPFVVRLSADGSQMSYATFVGRGDGGGGAGDALDQVVLTGRTNSNPPDFPVMNAFQPDRAGGFDAFVSKLTSDGSGLVFSTYLGGSDDENLIGKRDIATDPAGTIYVTGRTRSTDFPVQNAIQGAFGGGRDDAFVTKFTPQGAVVYSTYLGGSDRDQGMGVDANADGNTYVTGTTLSRDFPTQDPFQASHGGGVIFGDAFVTKIGPTGGELVFSTYLGGESNDKANDIVVVTGNDGVSVAHTPAGVGVVAVEVPPLGVVRITTDGAGDLIAGSITVDFDNPIGGVIRFTLDPFGTAGVLDSPLLRGFITPVRKNAEINTAIAVFNPLDERVSIRMILRDPAGEQIQGGGRSTAIEAFSHFAMFIDELLPSVPEALLEDFEGTLTVQATGLNDLITATALELGGEAGQFTALPVTPIP